MHIEEENGTEEKSSDEDNGGHAMKRDKDAWVNTNISASDAAKTEENAPNSNRKQA